MLDPIQNLEGRRSVVRKLVASAAPSSTVMEVMQRIPLYCLIRKYSLSYQAKLHGKPGQV